MGKGNSGTCELDGCELPLAGKPLTARFCSDEHRTRGYWSRDENRVKWNRRERMRRYGVSDPAFFDTVLAEQGGTCALCGSASPGHVRGGKQVGWHIDHDHNCCPGTGSCGECLRGMLCYSCNVHLVAGYEALPVELRDSPRLDAYLLRRIS